MDRLPAKPNAAPDLLRCDPIDPSAACLKDSPLVPIWQWAPNWRCPVLGMCLSLNEQRRLFKQPGKTARMRPYDLHQALMMAADDENTVSRRIDRLLRRKFHRIVAETVTLAPEEFLERWRRDWQSDEGFGLFYIAAARRDLDEQMRREIYGCIHMAGHTSAADLLSARQDAERQRQANARLARTVGKLRDQERQREQHRQCRIKARAAACRNPTVPVATAGSEPVACRLPIQTREAEDRLQEELRRMEREKRQLEIRNACKRVKGICKRLNKRLHILPSASLSAITAALHGGGAVIGGESTSVSPEIAQE